MLSRVTKIQLVAFAAVTATALMLMAAQYVQIPALLGIGRYQVTVQLTETGGLYPKSVVTYRGTQIGEVADIGLRDGGGVEATVSLDERVSLPADVVVEVRSASVIGEQYLNFVPQSAGGDVLVAGDVVPEDRTQIPVSTTTLLTSTNDFLASVPRDALNTTIDELGRAFAGNEQELGRLIDGSAEFTQLAADNLEPTVRLIEDLVPVLGTQLRTSAQIEAYAGSLETFTGALAASDQALEQVLVTGEPLAQEAGDLFTGLQPILPTLLTDLAATGQVVRTYLPGIEHIITVLPAAIEGQLSTVPPERLNDPYLEAGLSFKLNVNTPPVCVEGFEENDRQRSPKDTTTAPLPQDSYCKVPQDDPRVVRGARNQPCPNMPGTYAPTAAGCGLVFQAEEVQRGQLLTGTDTATYDPQTGRLLAPNGEFFLMDQLAADSAVPTTWQSLLTQMAGLP